MAQLAKTIEEVYDKIVKEIVLLLELEEAYDDCGDPMPQYTRGRLEALREVALFISLGEE